MTLIRAESGYLLATIDRGYYLWLPALFGAIVGVWALVLAVVPVLRPDPATPRRLLLAGAQAIVVLVAFVLIARVTLPN